MVFLVSSENNQLIIIHNYFIFRTFHVNIQIANTKNVYPQELVLPITIKI
jgi:hypothetical protein